MMDIKQMKKISIIWGTILVLIVIGLTAIGFLYKNKSGDYKKMEDRLVEVAKKYVDQKFLYPDLNKSVKVTYQEMKRENFISDLKKEEEECDGYVIVSNDGVHKYKGYVTCDKYTTKDYEK